MQIIIIYLLQIVAQFRVQTSEKYNYVILHVCIVLVQKWRDSNPNHTKEIPETNHFQKFYISQHHFLVYDNESEAIESLGEPKLAFIFKNKSLVCR